MCPNKNPQSDLGVRGAFLRLWLIPGWIIPQIVVAAYGCQENLERDTIGIHGGKRKCSTSLYKK